MVLYLIGISSSSEVFFCQVVACDKDAKTVPVILLMQHFPSVFNSVLCSLLHTFGLSLSHTHKPWLWTRQKWLAINLPTNKESKLLYSLMLVEGLPCTQTVCIFRIKHSETFFFSVPQQIEHFDRDLEVQNCCV